MEFCKPIGTCVDNPFKTTENLIDIIDRGREIKFLTFCKRCAVSQETLDAINKFRYDYTFARSTYQGKPIYFYTWSAIEHFYA